MGACHGKRYENSLSQENESKKAMVIHEGSILGLSAIPSVSSGSPFSTRVVSCSDDKKIASFLVEKSGVSDIKYSNEHKKAVNRVKMTKNYIWSVSRDLSARQYSLELESLATFDGIHDLNISSLAVNSEENRLFTGSRDYSVKAFDVSTNKLIRSFSAPRNIVTCIDVNDTHSDLIFQGSEDLCLRVWDLRSSSAHPVMHLKEYVYFPLCMSIKSDGNLLATGCKGFNGVGCEIKLWDIRSTKSLVGNWQGHTQDVTSCAFSPSNRNLLSVSKDGSLLVWDTESNVLTGRPVGRSSNTQRIYSSLSIIYEEIDKNGLNQNDRKYRNNLVCCAGCADGSMHVINAHSCESLQTDQKKNPSCNDIDITIDGDESSSMLELEDLHSTGQYFAPLNQSGN